MKVNLKTLTTFFISLSAVSYVSADTLTLSREQCVEIALRDNPTVKVADMEIKKVDYAKKGLCNELYGY